MILLRFGQKPFFRSPDHWMHDGFQPSHCHGIIDCALCEPLAVNSAVDGRPREGRFDRRDRLAFIKSMHGRVGVVNGYFLFSKEFRGGRLTHAKRAGETEDKHGSAVDKLGLSQKRQQWKQRKSENGEIIAVNPLKSDGCRCPRADRRRHC